MTPTPSAPHHGAFGNYGGRFVSELLVPALEQLEAAWQDIAQTEAFKQAFDCERRTWAGRPTPLTEVPNFSTHARLRVLLKREDLLHGGAHKTNNVIGQALLAKAMGKTRLIAETGAGQHGVATAMAGARFGMQTVIYMGAVDAARQRANVHRMKLCGAEVREVQSGSATLKDAINEALRDWADSVEHSHYLLGTVCGPHPFPSMVRDFQRVIGDEAKAQCQERFGCLPDAVMACVGGGSNAMGIFQAFMDDAVRLIGVEPGGAGVDSNRHGATLSKGTPGLLHGARTMVLQDAQGQITSSHSVSAGLDYPGVGPEHASMMETGRAEYITATDDEALRAFETLCQTEGILPAFESSHALAAAMHAVERGLLEEGSLVLINLSGRGDKDMDSWRKLQGDDQ